MVSDGPLSREDASCTVVVFGMDSHPYLTVQWVSIIKRLPTKQYSEDNVIEVTHSNIMTHLRILIPKYSVIQRLQH